MEAFSPTKNKLQPTRVPLRGFQPLSVPFIHFYESFKIPGRKAFYVEQNIYYTMNISWEPLFGRGRAGDNMRVWGFVSKEILGRMKLGQR